MNTDFKKMYIDIEIPSIDPDSMFYLDYVSLKLSYFTETSKMYNVFKTLSNDYVHENTLYDSKCVFNYPNEVKNKEIRTKLKDLLIQQNKRLSNFTSSVYNLLGNHS
jgi:hypothetical protein